MISGHCSLFTLTEKKRFSHFSLPWVKQKNIHTATKFLGLTRTLFNSQGNMSLVISLTNTRDKIFTLKLHWRIWRCCYGTELLSDVFRGQNSVQTSEKGFCPKENLRTGKNVQHFYQRISKIILKNTSV